MMFEDRRFEEREGYVNTTTDKAILFYDDSTGEEIWVPMSIVKDWWFAEGGEKNELTLKSLKLNDNVTLVLPKWFIRKEL